jgi:glycosyltransferase involved in cell wall biosynthesis
MDHVQGDCRTCAGFDPAVRCVAEPGAGRSFPVWAYCALAAQNPARHGPAIRRRSREAAGIDASGEPLFCRDPDRLNVAFIGNGYWPLGGTERWHQVLLPRLAALPDLHVLGYAVARECSGPDLGAIPIGRGDHAVRIALTLADVAVVWGMESLAPYLPTGRRPRLIGVSHGSPSNAWNVTCTDAMARVVDVRAAVSRHAAGAWRDAAGVVVIPNGVDRSSMTPSRSRESIRADLGLEPGDVACLSVGWVSEGKRVELAADAVRRLGRPFRLLVAGDGPQLDHVAAAGGDRVMLLGRRDDVPDLMHAADMLVHPSASEGMALVHIEAMLAGLPVVSTPVGHLADQPELARIVPIAAGPAGWAAAIAADWREGTARRQRVVLARATTEADCDADVFAGRWAALVRSLAAPAPSHAPAARIAPRGSQTPRSGIVAVARLDAARACDYRQPLSVPEQSACGCGGQGVAVCLLGKSRREDHRVSLGECVACEG